MLPFLKPRKADNTIIMQTKDAEGGAKPQSDGTERMKAAEALISAIHGKDATAASNALADLMSAPSAPKAE